MIAICKKEVVQAELFVWGGGALGWGWGKLGVRWEDFGVGANNIVKLHTHIFVKQ